MADSSKENKAYNYNIEEKRLEEQSQKITKILNSCIFDNNKQNKIFLKE
jgi:ribonucleotide reductase beta subunit family protein with ferritin-like domain